MHSLPCSNGGEDGVCMAITRLSKELMDDTTPGLQTGGCDSSDCLFCQYRSNSPFHLNAYAGKLTTLLRKRSLNGMALASRNTLLDASTEHCAVPPSNIKAAWCGGSKRHRIASSNGILAEPATAAGPSSALVPPSALPALLHSTPSSSSEAADAAVAAAAAPPRSMHHPPSPLGALHDCLTMCGGRLCSSHTSSARKTIPAAAVASSRANPFGVEHQRGMDRELPGANAPAAQAGAGPGVCDTLLLVRAGATIAALDDSAAASASIEREAEARRAPFPLPSPPDPHGKAEEDADVAGPGASSLCLMRLLQSRRRNHAREHSNYVNQHNRQAQAHQHGRQVQEEGPVLDCDDGQQESQAQSQVQTQQEPGFMICGRPLPEGWAFRSEWLDRADPAPAALQEVLQLPSTASYSRHTGPPAARGRWGSGSQWPGLGGCGGGGGGSTAIVCALEFSPDGRLLAAGGVDKQIRLYNLSCAFGDWGYDACDDDEDGGLIDDDEILLGLRGQRRGPSDLACRERDGERDGDGVGRSEDEGSAAGRYRRGVRPGGCNSADEDGEGGDDGDDMYGTLLAAVQRMPSKISSMAWSPFLDGVLTVGDYDGVLLQLHIASGHQLADVDAHGGRKIWSVAHSSLTPHLAASAADDRCARLWAGRGLTQCVASLQPNPHAAVCGVDFSPATEHLLSLACSDRTAYLYDTRNLGRGPLAALRHHSRPTSYCRFLGADQLVTAATDASLALWDISAAVPALTGIILPPLPMAAPQLAAPSPLSASGIVREYKKLVPSAGAAAAAAAAVGSHGGDAGNSGIGGGEPEARLCRVFRGHRNEKNFVGLSVRAADGLLACGSECSRAFAYHTSWSNPLATLDLPWNALVAPPRLPSADPLYVNPLGVAGQRCGGGWGAVGGGGCGGFVSAVCWQPAAAAAALGLPPLLASATSQGDVSISVLAARQR